MLNFNSSLRFKLLGILMFSGIIFLCILIYQDFSTELYDAWGRALARSITSFENNLATN
jgi:hypothetical protein